MPEIFRELGFRVFFYSDDHLPIHVHVSKNGKDAKFNVINGIPELVKSSGLKSKDLKLAQILRVCWKSFRRVRYKPTIRSCIEILRVEGGEVDDVHKTNEFYFFFTFVFCQTARLLDIFTESPCTYSLKNNTNISIINKMRVFQQTLKYIDACPAAHKTNPKSNIKN